MKNPVILIVVIVTILPILSCERQTPETECHLNWNGYDRYLETVTITHPLWTGKNLSVGSVTYGFENDASFYVRYDCSASGWLMAQTHLFAGDKKALPVDNSGHPQTSQFPNSGEHEPGLKMMKYTIPLEKLPPYGSPGFVVASHCVVKNPDGQIVSAWAEGDCAFADGAGWYDAFFYNPPPDQYPVLYSAAYESASLLLYHHDIKSGLADLILKEHIGSDASVANAATFDIETCMLFFTKVKELWLNQLNIDESSFCAGKLRGPSAGGAYLNGDYYYVNKALNTIDKVGFTNNWMISGEILLDTIPGSLTIQDIAMSPAGDCMYLIGQFDSGSNELIAWNLDDKTFYSTSIKLIKASRISFGTDNQLYSITPKGNNEINAMVQLIDIEKASFTPLDNQ